MTIELKIIVDFTFHWIEFVHLRAMLHLSDRPKQWVEFHLHRCSKNDLKLYRPVVSHVGWLWNKSFRIQSMQKKKNKCSSNVTQIELMTYFNRLSLKNNSISNPWFQFSMAEKKINSTDVKIQNHVKARVFYLSNVLKMWLLTSSIPKWNCCFGCLWIPIKCGEPKSANVKQAEKKKYRWFY